MCRVFHAIVSTNDQANNHVWAIMDHNSEFAAIPEPNSLALVGLAGLLVIRRPRRD